MSTIWGVKTNILYEMCCFLNTLCISKPYQDYYRSEYEYWMDVMGNDRMIQHLDRIRRKIYQERKQVISSELCLYFSMLSEGDPTIEDVLNIIDENRNSLDTRYELFEVENRV